MKTRRRFLKLASGIVIGFPSILRSQLVTIPGGVIFGSRAAPSGGGGGGGDTEYITGHTLGSTRNDTTARPGMQIVMSSTVTCTALARWVISGNTHTHTLYLKNSVGSTLQSVAVNTSGAPVGLLYGSITPQTLTSGQTYYIESDETTGDFWYDAASTTTTHTGVATMADSYNETAPFYGTDHTYVLMSFKYH